MVKKKFFNPYRDPFCPKGEENDGVNHPDFDPDAVTSISEYYRRFAADPEFRVSQVPPVYDLPEGNEGADEALFEADEPEFGSQDLEYLGNLSESQRAKKLNKRVEDSAEGSE